MPMPSMTYFKPRLEPVGAVAEIDEDADDGVGHFGGVRRLDDDPGIGGKILVAGDAADPELEPDAGLDIKTVFHLDRGKGDIVGVLEHCDLAGAVEGDVEFARQSRQRAVVEDVIVPFAGIFAGVQQFLRIDAGGRRARDVADVVGAGTARAQAEILDAFDQRDRILRRDFAHLQVGAGGDVGERSAQGLDQVGHSRKLPVLHDAVGNPQPAHVGILRRPDIEQPVIAPAEIVRRRRPRVEQRLFLQPRIGVERMLLALPLFLVDEFLAGGEHPVLRLDVRCLRPARLGGGFAGGRATEATPDPADLQARGEAFEVAFLLVGKVD